MLHQLGLILAIAIAGFAARRTSAQSTVLDPEIYRSPSQEYALSVDPSRPTGGGGADYRFSHEDVELWSGSRPWTLWRAEVTDAGLVAGYAYAQGHDGGREDALTLLLLDRDGRVRLEETVPRTGIRGHHGLPKPMVNGIYVDPDDDRLLVRISGEWETGEAWWSYSLASGASETKFHPRAKMPVDERLGWIYSVRALPGTSLTLAHWGWNDFDAGRYGAVFTLHEPDGEVCWRIDWPEDYTCEDEDEQDRLKGEIRNTGAIVAVTDEGRFTLRQVAKEELVTFEARRLPAPRDGVEVREIGRAPHETASPESTNVPQQAALELKHLGTIRIGSEDPSPSPIHDVMDFGLDGQGRIGVICRSDPRFDFLLVDTAGTQLGSLELPRAPEGKWWTFRTAWVGGNRWVVTGTGAHQDQDQAWWLDLGAGTLAPVPDFESPSIESLTGTRDGGFIVLGTTWYRSGYFTSDMVSFGPDGSRRWALGGDQGNPRDPSTLFAPAAVCFTSDGLVAVISNIRDLLQYFSADGAFVRAVDLTAAWGYEPRYPNGIHAGPAGEVVVHDFNGSSPFVCMDREDRVTRSIRPRFEDGRTFRARGDVQVGPDGTLWTSDGHCLLALDSTGVVERVVGSAPDPTRLGRIVAVALGPGDRVHAVDQRTGAVHVFDREGTLQHICRPEPKDLDDSLGSMTLGMSLSVDGSGEVMLSSLRFDADGNRIGKRDKSQRGTWYPGPHARSWVVGRSGLQLVESDGALVRTLDRDSENRWLRGFDRAAVAPDGSIAVSASSGAGDSKHVHVFSAEGEPLRTLQLPAGVPGWSNFAFDGTRLALGIREGESQPGSVVLLDLAGREQRFEPPRAVELWTPFFASDGRELWLFDGERRIERFALP